MAETVREIKKRLGHRLVAFDSGETLKIPHALFRQHPLKAGEELDLSAYRQRLKGEENRHALEAAVRMLETRDRSEEEVYKRLADAGFSGPAAAAAVARLMELGYLNDASYARQTVRRLSRKYGSLRIRQELRQKGVAEGIIEEALMASNPEDHLEAALALARKAYYRKQDEEEARYRRAYGALARRGYPPDVVQAAIQAVRKEAELSDGSGGG